MKGNISKTVVTTTIRVTRYNEETKTEEIVIRKMKSLRTPTRERIENWIMEEDRGYLGFEVLSITSEVFTMTADDFIKYATRKEK
jgi:hypothetical protein